MRAILSLALLLIGSIGASAQSASTLGPCSTPNYYSGLFHSGCLSATDLNNNNTAIYAAIAGAGGGAYLPLTGGTLTGNLNGTTATFTGVLAATTAAPGTSNTTVATTAFVATSFAPKASPTFTGTVTVPTPAPGDASTKAASTEFVATSFAPLASPALTGVPTAPTAAIGTATTQLATTAFATQGRSVAPGTMLGNPTTLAGAAADVVVGDTLSGGLYLDTATARFTGTAPTTYYLTKVPDSTGISGYYTAQRNLSALSNQTTTASLTGTTLTTVANFITPSKDPGANTFPPGSSQQYLYVSVDDASAQITVSVRVLARNSVTGVETNLGTATTPTLSGFVANTATGVWVNFRKQSAQAMGVNDRLVYRVLATRVGGPATIGFTLYTDGSVTRSTTASTITGPGQLGPDYQVNVVDFGAVADLVTQPDGIIALGSNILSSQAATFTLADVGKTIEVNDMLGIGAAPFVGTITGYTDAHTVTISGTATVATDGTYFMSGAATSNGGTAGAYVAGDIVCLVGGTYSVQACLTVVSTGVRPDSPTQPALGVVSAGSGGRPGTTTLRGTTGTGTTFSARGIIAADGTLQSVTLVTQGIYLANPSNLAAEPVTSDAGLVGATVQIYGMDTRTMAQQNSGVYTALPDDPADSTAGSISGATGATYNVTWQSVGRFAYFTDNRTAFANAMTRANDVSTTRRSVVRVPGGNYGITGAELPVFTRPVMIEGSGRGQTQVYFSSGYTGGQAFGWQDLFPNGVDSPAAGPTVMLSQGVQGAGARGITLAGNRFATTLPDGFVMFDRSGAMHFENIAGFDIASFIRTGVPRSTNIAYLRESYINDYFCQTCGTASKPVIWFEAVGTNAKNNNIQIDNGNIVFPVGVGFAITSKGNNVASGTKSITAQFLRIERGTAAQNPGTGDLLQFGSPTDTDDVRNVTMGPVLLISTQAGGSSVGFYGSTEASAPHGIRLENLSTSGPVLGYGINIQAGYNLYFGISNLIGRSGQIVTGNATPNVRYQGITVDTGSTAAAVAIAGGSTQNGTYVGGSLLWTVPAAFTAAINSGGTMTVSAVASGRIVVGTIVRGNGVRPVQVVTALGTGTGGTGTYTISNAQTVSSRAMTGIFQEARDITAYVGSTRVATLGSLQGSAASYSLTPQVGDLLQVQSLVKQSLYFDANRDEISFDWTGLGLNVAPLVATPLQPSGIPTGTQQLLNRLNLVNGMQLGAGTVPGSAAASCSAGDVAWDSGFIYLCIAANTWKRTAISTW